MIQCLVDDVWRDWTSGGFTTLKSLIPIMTANNLPAGYVASSDALFGSGFEPYKAFVGNKTSESIEFISNFTGSSYLQIEMPTAHTICQVRLKPTNDANKFQNFTISISTNGSEFTQVYSGTHENNANETTYEFTKVSAKYVRVTFTSKYTSEHNYITVQSMEVWGY